MNREKYEMCRTQLSAIDSISHEADILIQSARAYNEGGNTKAKLYIFADSSSTETVLTTKETNMAMIRILESHDENIKNRRDKLLKTIDDERSAIVKEILKLKNKVLEEEEK